MTDTELNTALAEALGWEKAWNGQEYVWCIDGLWRGSLQPSPATDRNHLAQYVLPEVEGLALFRDWVDAVLESTTDKAACGALETALVPPALLGVDPQEHAYAVAAILFGVPCHALAEAALKVLGRTWEEVPND